jgi:2-methylcitrate synthase
LTKKREKIRDISKNLIKIIKNYPKKSHPMDTTRTSISVMGLEDPETSDNSEKANYRKAIRLLAKISTAVAANFRMRKGKKIIKPNKKLSFSENFFHMCFGKVPSKEVVKAFDVSMILYAEHSFNASTFTSRVITSSLSDMHGAVTGAVASLKGPLHGGANEAVMHMLNEVKRPEQC